VPCAHQVKKDSFVSGLFAIISLGFGRTFFVV
jgi:hypothetical protein